MCLVVGTTQLTTWRTTARPTTTTTKPAPILLALIGCDLLLGMIRNHKLELTVMIRCVVNYIGIIYRRETALYYSQNRRYCMLVEVFNRCLSVILLKHYAVLILHSPEDARLCITIAVYVRAICGVNIVNSIAGLNAQ